MRSSITVLIWSIGSLSFGQATLRVDKTEIRIGDQVQATVEVRLSNGQEWVNAETLWPDTIAGIELASGPVKQTTDHDTPAMTWLLSFFDTGWVRIPALPVEVVQGSIRDTYYTLEIPIHVLAVEPDSSGLREIKEIYAEPFRWSYYRRYIPYLLGAGVLIAALVYWWRRKKKRTPLHVAIPEIKPHEWAFEALSTLEEKRLWQSGDIKGHYSELTGILRGYLERAFEIHALEQTSDEIISQLQSLRLSPTLLEDTASLLSMADMIKFAKADPGINIHADAVERVRHFVRNTLPPEPVGNETKPVADADMA